MMISVFAHSGLSAGLSAIFLIKQSKKWYGKGRHDFKYSPDMRKDVPISFLSNYDAGIKKEKDECRQLAREDAMNDFDKEYLYPGEQYKQNYEDVWKEVDRQKSEMFETGEEYGKYKTSMNEDILFVDDVPDELLDILRNTNNRTHPFKRRYFREGVITGSGQRSKIRHVAVRISDLKVYYLK